MKIGDIVFYVKDNSARACKMVAIDGDKMVGCDGQNIFYDCHATKFDALYEAALRQRRYASEAMKRLREKQDEFERHRETEQQLLRAAAIELRSSAHA